MTPSLHDPLVEQALRVAARAHSGQRRKASDLPYIVHPTAVALILANAGESDPEVLAAALLHDVVEDTPATMDELARQFPPRVIDIVGSLTEQKLDEDGNKRTWIDRKQDHLEHVRQASSDAQAVLLADKLHNLASMLEDLAIDGNDLWNRFGAPRDRILWYYRSMLDAVDQESNEVVKGLVTACETVLRRIEDYGCSD